MSCSRSANRYRTNLRPSFTHGSVRHRVQARIVAGPPGVPEQPLRWWAGAVRGALRSHQRPTGRPVDGRRLLAANIRVLRLERGLSQEARAELAAIHRTYLGSVERAERNVAIDNVCQIAWALGVEPAILLSAH
jgi:hypothetical protein